MSNEAHKYNQGVFSIMVFDDLHRKTNVNTSPCESHRAAEIQGEAMIAERPGWSYVIMRCIYNSAQKKGKW